MVKATDHPVDGMVTTKPAKKKIDAPWQFILLNVVRGLSITGLGLLFISSIVTMANDMKAVNDFTKDTCSNTNGTCDYVPNSTVPNQAAGAFWAVLNRLLIIFQVIVLIASEVGWPAKFFDMYFPILGMNFGLGSLGIIQVLLGAAVLSHHVDHFSLASAFFVFSIACMNILLGLIYREQCRPLRSIRAHRAAKNPKKDPEAILPAFNPHGGAPMSPGSMYSYTEKDKELMRSDSNASGSSSKGGMGFGRQGQKAAEAAGYAIQQPEEALPTYMSKPREPKNATTPVDPNASMPMPMPR